MEFDMTNEYSQNKVYPTIAITINGQRSVVPALLDTGASFTCVDESLVPAGTPVESQAPVVGVNDGNTDIANLLRNRYRADIEFAGHTFKNVLVTAIHDNDKAIIGMNGKSYAN